ncbi:universal stress protein [Actinoplanes sp. NPDC023714]|uniref:universal stress protein n=1 Tax=Actinoplanes sp. NPDC023714 TaxID=3154322 RepID=UPI0033FE4109
MSTRGTVLVGTDGSVTAQEAVRWAAVEAQRREVTLTVLYAYEDEWPTMPGMLPQRTVEAARDHAEVVVSGARLAVQQIAPGLTVHTEAIPGDPAAVLVRQAGTAGLMVVGHRGDGGFTSLMLGSVGHSVAAHASCPVAVVRGRSMAASGPVAVSADGAPGSDTAIESAFAEANARGAAVLAVRAYREPMPPVTPGLPTLRLVSPAEHEKSLTDELEARLAPWRREFPAVPVGTVISAGSVARLLVGASHQAQLVVVSHYGPAWSQLLHHADCPVLIVRK